MKYRIIIFIPLILIAVHKAYAGLFGLMEIRGITSDNVYEDSSRLSDAGIIMSADVNYFGKISETTYPRIGYSFSSTYYPDVKLDNETDHLFTAAIKQSLADYIDLDLMGGYGSYQMTSAKTYSSQVVYGKPALYIYPLSSTEIDAGCIFEKVSYPDYDLDNTGLGYFGTVYQDLPYEMSAVVKGTVITRNYSNRAVFDATIITSPTVSTSWREDREYDYAITLKRYVDALGMFELEYQRAILDSTANEFYWGPGQTSETNTITGDERILEDYWDYAQQRYGIRYRSAIFKKISAEIYGSYQQRKYTGWVARTASDAFLPADDLRNDTLFLIYGEVKREIYKNLNLIGIYVYKNNNSNDYYYDAHTSLFSLGLEYHF